MSHKTFFAGVVALLPTMSLALYAADAKTGASTTKLTATEIVAKNVSARGGASAWRAIQTMSMSGKMEAGTKSNVQLPFSLELKRGRKSRLELQFAGQSAVQIYDGVNGWKLRPFLNRRVVETFTAEELKQAGAQTDLDGLLIDYAGNGRKVALDGIEKVRDHDAYKLKVTSRDGQVRNIWLDTQTFLEVKVEGNPRRLDGRYRPVATYFQDYRQVQGVTVPYLVETVVEGVLQSEKIVIEKVAINPQLDDSRFVKPVL